MAGPRDDADVIPLARRHRLLDRPGLAPALLDGLAAVAAAGGRAAGGGRASRHGNALLGELARIRRGQQPDAAVLGASAEEFSAWMAAACRRVFRGQGGRAWEHLQGEDRLMRFGLEEDPTAGRLGAGLEVAPAPGGRTGALSFHVLSSAVDKPRSRGCGACGRAEAPAPAFRTWTP
ncbi:hypothetical protein ACQEVM_17650 [Streptomyces sp. CA-243310]|uniref:hypothetical protein n=1 Tax=Streptomyces sp. CA-243310 TaxID=3240056 RepID=UPI003D93F71C